MAREQPVNGWVPQTRPAPQEIQRPTADIAPVKSRAVTPQPGAVSPGGTGTMPAAQAPAAASARWWWLGCHGGAGVTTLTHAVPGGADAGRVWPRPAPGGRAPVLLVARTHASGLQAAQLAAQQWASGALPGVDVLGLVLVADAPGKYPRPLAQLRKLVAGGVPRAWHVPWCEPWRCGELPAPETAPRELRALTRELSRLIPAEESRV